MNKLTRITILTAMFVLGLATGLVLYEAFLAPIVWDKAYKQGQQSHLIINKPEIRR